MPPLALQKGQAAYPLIGVRSATRRMAMFAFTSAELLLEVALDGTILFAEGAFRRYFDRPGEAFLHQNVEVLFATSDRKHVQRVLSVLATKARVSPIMVRLADAKGTQAVLHAMRGDVATQGVFVTLGPPPVEAIDMFAVNIQPAAEFIDQAVEHLLSDSENARLTFLEVQDRVGGLQQTDIHKAIHQVVSSESTVGDMAPGRFGILNPQLEPAELERRVVEALHRFGRNATVSATAISLATGDLPAERAAVILQLLLESFIAEGVPGLAQASGGRGLIGAVEEVRAQSRRIAAAIRDQAFDLEFQPICDIHSREVHHYEALIRPGDGLPPAYRFVRVAEEAGLSEQLDLAVLSKALAFAKGKHVIAVNVSGYSVQKPSFLNEFFPRAKERAQNLIVELTETAEIQEKRFAAQFFEELAHSGIKICFDDFGAGAAGLQYIRDYPVDYVKVDGSYVRAAVTNARQRAILYSMIEMAQAVGAQTIAEFVETEEQARLMESMGIQLIQGWLVGKPAPFPSLDTLLRGTGLRR